MARLTTYDKVSMQFSAILILALTFSTCVLGGGTHNLMLVGGFETSHRITGSDGM